MEAVKDMREPGERPEAVTRRVRRGSAEYPDRLLHLHAPPGALWARGPLRLPSERMVGIVGTRRATEYGRRVAHDLAFDLASAGWVVVSGLAGGIDAAAHRGALAAGGETIGVLGCGINRVYPVSNRDLYGAIGRRGLLLSEYEPDAPPQKYHFPERNRIIAALSSAVVVAQAGERSGALITADLALELGREVLAVPGPIDQVVSRGVHELLRSGAGVVESAADVLRQLGESPGCPPGGVQRSLFDVGDQSDNACGKPAGRLRRELADGPAPLHDLATAVGLDVSEALATLSRLELGGVVRSLPGHRFELVRPS